MNEERRRRNESSFDDEVGERILAGLIEGKSVAALCRLPGMPTQRTVYRWLVSHPGFRRDYVMARNLQAERLAEEILEIADSGDEGGSKPEAIDRAKLRIEARKWYLGRLRPHTHGPAVAGGVEPAALGADWRVLSDTERVQRLLALINGARNGTPIEQTATGEPTASGDATNEDRDEAAE